MSSPVASTSAALVSDLETQATIFKRLHPHTYLDSFLDAQPSIREDGRSSFEFRPAQIVIGSISTALGSCTVRLGQTTIIAGVTAEIGRVESHLDDAGERRDRGWIVPSLDMSPMCSPKFKSGPPSEEAQILTSRIATLLESCKPIDLRTLSVHEGEAAWCLYVDLVCLSYDGGILDASMLAIAGALSDASLPAAKWDAEEMEVVCSSDPADRQRLRVQSLPLVSSFGIYKTHLLSDCSAFEAALSTSEIAICMTAQDNKQATPPIVTHLYQAGKCACVHRTLEAEIENVKLESERSTPDVKELQKVLGVANRQQNGHLKLDDELTLELCFIRAKRRFKYLETLLEEALKNG